MALQMDINLETGINLPEAYVRVTDVMLSYGQDRGWVTVYYYANKIARTERKNPVKVDEFRVFDQNGIDQQEAVYEIGVAEDIVSGSGATLNLDVDGDGVNDISIVEGTDFTVGTTNQDTIVAMVDALNLNATFNVDFVASIPANTGVILVTAKTDGAFAGVKGNNVVASGNAIITSSKVKDGVDYVPSDFDKYFSISDMSTADVNVISQAYGFIKELDQFSTALSV